MDRLEVVTGDITQLEFDVIVNAANERMLGGGGVDGAIHRAAGPELLEACRALDEVRSGVRCPTGEARLTEAFALRARYIVHTVGPVWEGGSRGEQDKLASCYIESLRLAHAHAARSIAFPAISTGVFGYPKAAAAEVAVRECATFLDETPAFERIALVAFHEPDAAVLRRALEAVAGRSS